MVIDHIGLVVKSVEKGITHWREVFGYEQMTDIVVNTRQGVRVAFLEKPGSLTVKLLEPVDKSSSVFAFAKKGGGLHHLCFKVGSMSNELKRLESLGLRILAEPAPGEAFENEDIAFVYAQHGLNVEIIETDKKACLRRG